MRFAFFPTLAVCLLATPSLAQIQIPEIAVPQNQRENGLSQRERPMEIVIVTAGFPKARSSMLLGTSVLSGDALNRELRVSIGETLSRQVGVSATSFGPNASRPVLRGLQGERVRVLSEGIGSFDVSNASVDHAVAINPLTAERIEILRGPSALLFGSSAIGGVVNVIQDRIPRVVPDGAVSANMLVNLGSAADEATLGLHVDVPLSDKIVFHVDGTSSRSQDLRIGGFVLTPALRAAARASGDEDIQALADLSDRLPNSAAESTELAAGLSYIADALNFGVSVAHYESLYGVPVRYAIDPDLKAEAVFLDVEQTRYDLRGEFKPTEGLFELFRLRGGYADYNHSEIEETGEIATTFFNEAYEGRAELIQRDRGGWRGVIGAQGFMRDLFIIGEEKFLPENQVRQFGLFTVQSFNLGKISTEIGARIEQTNLKAKADEDLGNPSLSSEFTTFSGSIGGNIEIAPDWRVGLNASYTQRAPAAEELFANGPHAATQAFEVGNPNFKREAAAGIEAIVTRQTQRLSLSASLYYNDFDGFIFEQPTGEVEDDLPVFQFFQKGARHYGGEIEVKYEVATLGLYTINVDAIADMTRATLKDGGGNVPRIPALRVLSGIEALSETFDARIEVEWVDQQNETADFETATKSYALANFSAVFRPFPEREETSVTLSVNNVFDEDARRHASFLKDYAPLAGRDVRLTLRMGF